MPVSILFFGQTAEITGHRTIGRAHAAGESVRSIVESICEQFPSLRRQKLLYALNEKYATGDETLRDGDELAVFTPVSGG